MTHPVDNRQQLQSMKAKTLRRGSGRIFSALTMSADNPLTVNRLSADSQHDRVDDTDNDTGNGSPVTVKKVLLTTR
jgi:hypothetical protein